MNTTGIKKIALPAALSLLLFSSCRDNDGEYDASGVFEATEVVVSAQGAGEIVELNIEEGQEVTAGFLLGHIDTVQLHLRKEQLQANRLAVASRRYDIPRQVASLQQQIETQKREQLRFENLVKSNAANQKQLDDINAQIALLEKQLSAQIESLENNNRSVAGEFKNRISSPITGTILTKYAEPGELATQGRSLFKVADIEHLFLRAYVTAGQLTMMKIGQPVRVFADEGESGRREYAGTVTWISDKAEFTPKTIQTRDERANLVYAVKIAVKNDGYIKRGMYGEIKIAKK